MVVSSNSWLLDMAMEIDISSNALNKNTQFNTRNTPHNKVCQTSFLFHFSVLCPPVKYHSPPKNKVAKIHRTKTSSRAGIPLLVEKKPTEPKGCSYCNCRGICKQYAGFVKQGLIKE